jgi:peroxiredoxin
VHPQGLFASALCCALGLTTGCGGPPAGPTAPTAGPTTTTADDAPPAGATAPTQSGPKAPDFTLPTLDGKRARLSDHLGKRVILLDFWHTTCHPCIQELPELRQLYHQYRDRGFIVLGITTDGPETRADVTSVVRDNRLDFPILLDEETAVQDRYNPKGELPFTVLINRSGAIVLKRASYQAGDEKSMKQLVDAIEAALAAP